MYIITTMRALTKETSGPNANGKKTKNEHQVEKYKETDKSKKHNQGSQRILE